MNQLLEAEEKGAYKSDEPEAAPSCHPGNPVYEP
jgi:hypothetical protein